MASWDSVQSPGPPDLRPPKIDFSPIGNIVNTYRQGTEANRQEAIRTALNDPSLYDEQGKIDANKAANKLFQLGGYDQARSVLTTAEFMKGAPPQQPGPWSIAAQQFLQPGPPPATQPQSGGGMQPQPVADPRVGVSPVRDPNLSPEEQISPAQVAAANQPRPVPQQPGPAVPDAGPTPMGPAPAQAAPAQAAAPASAVDTSAADSMVPKPFRDAGWNGDRYRTMLHATAEQLRQQAAATEHQNAYGGIRQDTKPVLDRAAALDAQAAEFDKMLAPTTEQRDVATGVPRQKAQQEAAQKRGEAAYTGIGQVAKLWNTGGGKTLNGLAKSILNQPALYTGFGANQVLDIRKVQAALGGNPNAAMYVEALKKLTAADVLNTINATRAEASEGAPNGNAGRTFQSQVEQAEKTALNTESTISGNMFLAELKGRMGEYSVRLKSLADDYYKQHKTLDEGFDKIVDADLKKRPLFTEAELKNPSLIGVPTSPYTDPGQTAAWGQQMGLKDGVAIRSPGGKLIHLRLTIRPSDRSR